MKSNELSFCVVECDGQDTDIDIEEWLADLLTSYWLSQNTETNSDEEKKCLKESSRRQT